MNENPFKKQEKLDIKVELATPNDWQACKDLRIFSITGSDADMYGLTPEEKDEELGKDEAQWRRESCGDEMFSVLSWSGPEAIGLSRAKQEGEGVWRIRNGYVKPDFRNKGIDQKMFSLRLNEIRRRGGTKVVTGIMIKNKVSVHIAEKFGFKIVHSDDIWYRMELDLSSPEIIKKIDEALNAR